MLLVLGKRWLYRLKLMTTIALTARMVSISFPPVPQRHFLKFRIASLVTYQEFFRLLPDFFQDGSKFEDSRSTSGNNDLEPRERVACCTIREP